MTPKTDPYKINFGKLLDQDAGWPSRVCCLLLKSGIRDLVLHACSPDGGGGFNRSAHSLQKLGDGVGKQGVLKRGDISEKSLKTKPGKYWYDARLSSKPFNSLNAVIQPGHGRPLLPILAHAHPSGNALFCSPFQFHFAVLSLSLSLPFPFPLPFPTTLPNSLLRSPLLLPSIFPRVLRIGKPLTFCLFTDSVNFVLRFY